MKKGRVLTLGWATYFVICLGEMLLELTQDRTPGFILSKLFSWAGSASDPVLRAILYVFVVGLIVVFVPGCIVVMLCLVCLLLALLLIGWVFKAAFWLAALSPVGAVVVILPVLIALVVLVYKFWNVIIRTLARGVLALRSLKGMATGEDIHYPQAGVMTRAGGVLFLLGGVFLLIGLSQRVPHWFGQIQQAMKPLPVQEIVIVAPVNGWSDTFETPAADSRKYVRSIFVEGHVMVESDTGKRFKMSPRVLVGLDAFKSLRWRSLTGRPVKVHVVSMAPIVIHNQTNPAKTLRVSAPVGRWSDPIDVTGGASMDFEGDCLMQDDHGNVIKPMRRSRVGTKTLRFQSKTSSPVIVHISWRAVSSSSISADKLTTEHSNSSHTPLLQSPVDQGEQIRIVAPVGAWSERIQIPKGTGQVKCSISGTVFARVDSASIWGINPGDSLPLTANTQSFEFKALGNKNVVVLLSVQRNPASSIDDIKLENAGTPVVPVGPLP